MLRRILFAIIPILLRADTVPVYSIQTVAGSPTPGDGNNALLALFSQTEGITVDGAGNVYVADAGDNRVRKITPAGAILTVIGTGVPGFSGDGGPGSAAQLSHPYGLAMDRSGNLFIADLGNGRVRKFDARGQISTVAGGGSTPPGSGGPATSAKLTAPRNLAVDADGTLYISDFGAHVVLRISPAGVMTAVAGNGKAGYAGDGGAAAAAQVSSPAGLALDRSGALYLADSGNNRIRRIFGQSISTVFLITGPTGIAVNPAGTLYVAAGSFTGTTAHALLSTTAVQDIATDSMGNLYLTGGPFVRVLSAAGKLTTIAGSGASPYYGGDGGPAASARLHSPSSIVRDDLGNWYISDTGNHRIRKIDTAGVVTTYAGNGEAGITGDGGLATLAELNAPGCLALDSRQNLYAADTGNNSVRKISPAGIIVTVADQLKLPRCLAVDANDNLIVADTGNNRIVQIAPGGAVIPVTDSLGPVGLAMDAAGVLYIAESSRVAKWTGTDGYSVVADGLNAPGGLAINGDGAVLVSETGGNRIRMLGAGGSRAIIAGTGAAGFAGDGGAAVSAQLSAPMGLAVDSSGTVYFTDAGNHRIRTLTPPAGAAALMSPVEATVVNAASLAGGPIAPGEIITIFGGGFDPSATQVLFDGHPATVFYVDANQINCLAPVSLAAGSSTGMSIVVNGIGLVYSVLPVIAAAPGIFRGIANENGSLNSAANPAARGSVVTFYATGGGLDVTGVSLTMGGYAAELLYAGPAPGYAGLMQINARVPAGFLPPGNQSVVLRIAGAQSQAGVGITLK